jgi:hypothetical protein
MRTGLVAVILSLAAIVHPTAAAAADPPASAGVLASPTPVEPVNVVTLAERTLATITIQNPDSTVELDGAVWVRTDDGRVVQVDADTGSVVAEVKVDTTSDLYHYCQALGADASSIWTCSAAGGEDDRTIAIVQVDPVDHRVVRTVPVDMIFDQFELPFADGRIWALVDGGSSVVGIDVLTGEPTAPTGLDARCTQLSALGDSIAAVCPSDDAVLVIDPEGPSVARRADVDGPVFLASSTDDLWVARERSIARLDPGTLAIVAELGPLPGVFDLSIDDDSLWIRQGIAFLYRLDRATGQVTEQITPDIILSPGSVLATGDSVWATANDEGVLVRVSVAGSP